MWIAQWSVLCCQVFGGSSVLLFTKPFRKQVLFTVSAPGGFLKRWRRLLRFMMTWLSQSNLKKSHFHWATKKKRWLSHQHMITIRFFFCFVFKRPHFSKMNQLYQSFLDVLLSHLFFRRSLEWRSKSRMGRRSIEPQRGGSPIPGWQNDSVRRNEITAIYFNNIAHFNLWKYTGYCFRLST